SRLTGTGGFLSDLRLHQPAGLAAVEPSSGHFAPWSIQAFSVAMSAAASGSFGFGGIGRSLSCPLTSCTSRLSADLPGTITAPLSPPARASALRSNLRPCFCLSGPWQE